MEKPSEVKKTKFPNRESKNPKRKLFEIKEEVSTELILGHDYSLVSNKRNTVSQEEKAKSKKIKQQQEALEDEEERNLGVCLRLKLFNDPWKIKKRLTQCDINDSSRLLLASELVLNHVVPWLDANRARLCMTVGGTRVNVMDFDTWTEHSLVLKRWATGSFVLTSNWMKEFVNRRVLEVGDEVGLFWERAEGKFCFRILERV